jgi:hypothetical protein
MLIIGRMGDRDAKTDANPSAIGQALTYSPRKLEPVAGVASSFSGTVHGACSRKPVSGCAFCVAMTYLLPGAPLEKKAARTYSTVRSRPRTASIMLSSSLLAVALPNVAAAAYAFDPLQHLAGIAPYFEDPLLDPKAPQGCNVTRASMLVRHAAIYAYDFFDAQLQSSANSVKERL